MRWNEMPVNWLPGTLEDVVCEKRYSFTGGPFGSDLQTKDYTDEGVQIIQLQNIGDGEFLNNSRVYTSEQKADQLQSCNIYPGDIILAKMADPVARGCIIPNFANRFLMASDGIRVEVNQLKHNTYYILTAINFHHFRRQAENKSTGTTRARIGLTELKNIKFFIPPLLQQQKIAKILSTCDEVIEKTEAAITKYQFIKQGMMHDLFTRGIDLKTGKLRPKYEDASELYKESELGRIPKEWEVKRIEEVSSLVTNGFVGVATPFYTNRDNGVLYLFGTNIRPNYLDYRDVRYVSKEFHTKHIKSQLREGDMLTVQSGHIGTSAVIPSGYVDANCHALIITRFDKESVNSDYISHYLNSDLGIKQLEKLFIGSTIKHINTSGLAKHQIFIPTMEEQNISVSKLKLVQKNIEFEQSTLAKYQQLKSGLTQDLLTGKVEVVADTVQEEVA